MIDAERHHRAAEIFLAACRLDGAEREAWIARACGADGALESEVRSLLRHDAANEATTGRDELLAAVLERQGRYEEAE